MEKEIQISQKSWDEICRHAVDTYPEECCGVMVEGAGEETVFRCTNIQNRLHQLDAKTYPRDATIAYAMDVKELLAVQREAQASGRAIKAFYHSHPKHEAYFSEEDRASATPFGEPTYPDVHQLVISIYDGAVKQICAYHWSEEQKDFIQIPLKKV